MYHRGRVICVISVDLGSRGPRVNLVALRQAGDTKYIVRIERSKECDTKLAVSVTIVTGCYPVFIVVISDHESGACGACVLYEEEGNTTHSHCGQHASNPSR